MNSLGPVTLTKGKYKILIHPDMESEHQKPGSEIFKFGLDVLLEKSNIGSSKDTQAIVEKIELCNIPTLPTDFNGPGFINSLSGNTMQFSNKYRVSELLEGAHIKFDLAEASQIAFYIELPEDLEAGAKLTKVKASHET
jgi:hypothetical protein